MGSKRKSSRLNKLIYAREQREKMRVKGFLNMLAEKLPFKAKVVNYEMRQKEKEQKQLLEKLNENEYSRKFFIRNNMLGCWDYVSPYEVEWDGRFR
ncbi:hypothetical protein QYM36_012589 [Artemia franciscana]|uniref:Uncharacterized protein n=1 Tax=Artemia franciscana TaxID=6661 RepID=A0AA88HL79_ARTSF|nr:hypothetical protein QYM36_012589 [Artemia franciscana]